MSETCQTIRPVPCLAVQHHSLHEAVSVNIFLFLRSDALCGFGKILFPCSVQIRSNLLQLLQFKFPNVFLGVSCPPCVALQIERHVCTASFHMRRHRLVYLALYVLQRIRKTFGQRLYDVSPFIFNVFPALSDVLESPRRAPAASTFTISVNMPSDYVLVLS